jgi:hypothetical protein
MTIVVVVKLKIKYSAIGTIIPTKPHSKNIENPPPEVV